MLKQWWEKLVRVDASSATGQILYVCMLMGAATVLAIVEAVLLRFWAPIFAAAVGWAFVGVFALFHSTLFQRTGAAIGSITVPSGSSTPSVAQHSNIEALEMQGRYADAAAAYQSVIAAEPQDLVACEKLGQLALRQLKQFDLAVLAFREAEKRSLEPRRQAGYALLVAGVYRDNLKDYGKAMVELRRILARYPDVPNAEHLRAEIDELKALHFEAP